MSESGPFVFIDLSKSWHPEYDSYILYTASDSAGIWHCQEPFGIAWNYLPSPEQSSETIW